VSREESWRRSRHRASKIHDFRLVGQVVRSKRAVGGIVPVWQLLLRQVSINGSIGCAERHATLTLGFVFLSLGRVLILIQSRTAAKDGGQPASIVSIVVDDEAH
jgi:hypothetical protein